MMTILLFILLLVNPVYAIEKGQCILWLDFEEASGTFIDKSGYANHGTAHGTVSYQEDGAPNRGYGVSFNDVADYIDCGDSYKFDPTNITLEAWIKPSAITGNQSFVSRNAAYRLMLEDNKAQLIIIGDSVGYSGVQEDTGTVVVGEWVHIVGTFDSSLGSNQMKLYVNGVLSKEGDLNDCIRNGNQVLTIGTQNPAGSNYFVGSIDGVKIYNYALSAIQVKTSYQQGGAR